MRTFLIPIIRTNCFRRAVGMLLALCAASALGQTSSIEGTWQLTIRRLADGTTLHPPDVMGLLSLSKGRRNLNVLWKNHDGQWSSHSVAATYRLTSTHYTETLMFSAYHSAGSDRGVQYKTAGETKSVPITIDGDRVVIPIPWGEPTLEFDGRRMTATLKGAFVDAWEKVDEGGR